MTSYIQHIMRLREQHQDDLDRLKDFQAAYFNALPMLDSIHLLDSIEDTQREIDYLNSQLA